MGISPLGIVNAGDPAGAYREAFEAAGLIHHNYCREAAAMMAAAVAAAISPEATVDRVVSDSVALLPPDENGVMRRSLSETLRVAREAGGYEEFRARFYDELMLPRIAIADSRETVPVTMALFTLAKGDPREAIIMGANFGRDADTIASMAGALTGAFAGAKALPAAWVEKVASGGGRDQESLARALCGRTRGNTA